MTQRIADGFEPFPKMSRDEIYKKLMESYQQEYVSYWLLNDDNYWGTRLLEEVTEALGVINETHDDNLEHELFQIASVCINWLIKINGEK